MLKNNSILLTLGLFNTTASNLSLCVKFESEKEKKKIIISRCIHPSKPYQDTSSLSLLVSVMLASATGRVNTLRNRAIILLQNLMPAENIEIMILDVSVGMSTAVARKVLRNPFFAVHQIL